MALFILLFLVLPGGPSNKTDIKPWLPICVVLTCCVTAVIHGLPFRITRNRYPAVAQVQGGLHFGQPSTPHPGDPGYRTSSEWSHPRAPSDSYRNDPNSFRYMGPGSSRSLQTGSGGTEYTLRDLDGARRDPQAAHFIYGNSHVDQVRLPSGDLRLVTARGADAYEAVAGMELDRDRISQDSALESRAPLLGSND